MKRCCTCKEEKELNEFGKHKGHEDGFRPECKECRNAKLRTGKPNLGRFKKGHIPSCPFKRGHVPLRRFPKGHIPWNKGKRTQGCRYNLLALDWAKQIKERDCYTCIECGAHQKDGTTKRIIAHHIIPWKENPDLRFDMDNGITLCQPCHAKLEGFQIGHKLSEASMNKLKNSLKGRTSSNKGKQASEETKKRMSESHKGQAPWNKGLKMKKELS